MPLCLRMSRKGPEWSAIGKLTSGLPVTRPGDSAYAALLASCNAVVECRSRHGRIARSMARRGFMKLLVIPWVDKTIAIVACLPFVVELYRRWAVGHVNFPRAV